MKSAARATGVEIRRQTCGRACLIGIAAWIVLLGAPSPGFSKDIQINIGTVAPEGSPWHQILQKMGQEWQKASGGKVTVRIFPNGRQGDESEMLRRVRQATTLQAVALSGAGLSQVDISVSSLQVPLLMDSYAELDYVRKQIEPRLEGAILARGFIVLNWSDVGWVHFFSKKPARTPDDVRGLKLFITAGDPDTEALYKALRFRPVPLGANELVTSLQTNLIDAFDVPPLFAQLNQSFSGMYMIDMKWAPLIGATIVSRQAWEQIDESLHPELLRIARNAGDELRGKIRAMGDQAVDQMVSRKGGLTVIRLSPQEIAQWRQEARTAYSKMRGTLVPAGLFDEVLKLSEEFRTGNVDHRR
jgi:TRAP-type C4-dicarboxylate transport system substrate-binding protein